MESLSPLEREGCHRYLMHVGQTGSVVFVSRNRDSDEYGLNQRLFSQKYSKKKDLVNGEIWPAEMTSLWADQVTPSGLFYDYDLCYDGGLYRVIKLPWQSNDQLIQAKNYIRSSFDVVRLTTLSIINIVRWDWKHE